MIEIDFCGNRGWIIIGGGIAICLVSGIIGWWKSIGRPQQPNHMVLEFRYKSAIQNALDFLIYRKATQ